MQDPYSKGKGSAVEQTTSTANMSAGPMLQILELRLKGQPVVTVTMLQDLVGELQAIGQESLDDDS